MSSDLKAADHTQSPSHSIKNEHVENGGEIYSEILVINEETNRKLLRKIDLCLMPVMCLTYA